MFPGFKRKWIFYQRVFLSKKENLTPDHTPKYIRGEEISTNGEQEKGFKSFGSYCNDVINYVSADNFENESELNEYFESHSDFIQISNDSALEPRLMLSPYRYLVNAEQKCRVGDDVIVLRENGVFVCESTKNTKTGKGDTLSLFSHISEKGYITDGYAVAKHNKRKMKVWIWLERSVFNYNEYAHQLVIKTKTYDKVWRPFTWKWKAKRHNHRVSFSGSIQHRENGGTWNTETVSDSYRKNHRKTYYYRGTFALSAYHPLQMRIGDFYLEAWDAGLNGKRAIISN